MKRDRVALDADGCKVLVPGGLYFHTGYRQPGVNLPEIVTLVYLGEEMTDATDDDPSHPLHIFQRADSYQDLGDWSELSADLRKEIAGDVLLGFDTRSVTGIYDLAGLIVSLQRLQRLISQGLSWECVLPEER